jgi:hypothetical protein
MHILNQGISGTSNTYGLFVDAQSGSANNYSAIFAGGNVGIGLNNPSSPLTVNGMIESKSGGIKFPDGTTQTTAVNGAGFVQKAGDTMTGALNLPANGLVVGTNQLVSSGGKIGIGSVSPSTPLTVENDIAGVTNLLEMTNRSAAAADLGSQLFFSGTAGTPQAAIRGAWNGAATTDAYMSFFTRGTSSLSERMRIASSGNVGIGTAAPAKELVVGGGAGASGIANNGIFVNIPGGAAITARDSTAGVEVQVNAESSGIGTVGTQSNHPLNFRTNNVEAVRIDTAGNVGIGVTAPSQKLQVVGDIRIGTSGTNGCVMNFNSTGIAGTCSSDRRMKRDITPFPKLLDRVVKLQPVDFYWRSAEFPERHFGPAQSYGLIAQEVEQVLPELVVKDEQGYKMVDYSKLPLLLLQAVKDLKVENETLQQRNERLQQESTAMQQQHAALDARLRLIERTLRNKRDSTRRRR